MLLAFAAEPGPRNWSWICLAPPDFGGGPSFLSFHDGQVLMSGTPADVVENENVRRVYLGDNFRIS